MPQYPSPSIKFVEGGLGIIRQCDPPPVDVAKILFHISEDSLWAWYWHFRIAELPQEAVLYL